MHISSSLMDLLFFKPLRLPYDSSIRPPLSRRRQGQRGLLVNDLSLRHGEMDLERLIEQDEVGILPYLQAALVGGNANSSGGVQAGGDPQLAEGTRRGRAQVLQGALHGENGAC